MATKLSKPVTREIVMKTINGIAGDVAVTISATGVSFAKGRRKLPEIPWEDIGRLVTLPPNIPAKFTGDKFGWLLELSMDTKAPSNPAANSVAPAAMGVAPVAGVDNHFVSAPEMGIDNPVVMN